MSKKKSYRRYSPEFKREAIKRACEEGVKADFSGCLLHVLTPAVSILNLQTRKSPRGGELLISDSRLWRVTPGTSGQ
jgi:hypothetical protein